MGPSCFPSESLLKLECIREPGPNSGMGGWNFFEATTVFPVGMDACKSVMEEIGWKCTYKD